MVTSRSCHAFFCGITKAGGGKSAYAHFGMQIILLFSNFKMATCSGYDADSERSYL